MVRSDEMDANDPIRIVYLLPTRLNTARKTRVISVSVASIEEGP